MRCETCQGAGGGMVLMVNPAWRRWAVCADCGGSGIVHCCDGDRACPDKPAPESATAARGTENAGC